VFRLQLPKKKRKYTYGACSAPVNPSAAVVEGPVVPLYHGTEAETGRAGSYAVPCGCLVFRTYELAQL
jgi:hypothetical protein